MRLGFDLDEVVVDLTAEFDKYLQAAHGIEWPAECYVSYNFSDCLFDPEDEERNAAIIKDMYAQLVKPDLTDAAEPVKDATKVLIELKRRGHKIYFISSRPKQIQPETFKWLRKYGIPFDGLKVIGQSVPKGVYGRNLHLDMFVDDLPAHLENMWKFKKRWRKGLLLFDKPWNGSSVDGSKFIRVLNWQDILRHVGIQNR